MCGYIYTQDIYTLKDRLIKIRASLRLSFTHLQTAFTAHSSHLGSDINLMFGKNTLGLQTSRLITSMSKLAITSVFLATTDTFIPYIHEAEDIYHNICVGNKYQLSETTHKLCGLFYECILSKLSALLQLHLHSRLNSLLIWIEQRQLQDETRKIPVLGFGVYYIRGLVVYTLLFLDELVHY